MAGCYRSMGYSETSDACGLGMTDYFEALHGSKLHGTRSNKAVLIGWIIQRHHLDASKAVMIGDRSHDIIAARANGIASVGVLHGYGTHNELLEAGPTVLCEHPLMLLDALSSLASSSLGR
jgi:phosphoglycolate phosphatase